MLSEMWFIVISTVLVNNLVLTQFLGLDPALSASRSLRPALLLCAATSVVLLITSVFVWLARLWLPAQPSSLAPVLVIGVLVAAVAATLVDRIVRDIAPLPHRSLGHHLPLLFANGAILGTSLSLTDTEGSTLTFVARVFASMLAFTLVMIIMSCARQRLRGADVPAAFEGAAISVMTLGLLALAFTGFSGMAGA